MLPFRSWNAFHKRKSNMRLPDCAQAARAGLKAAGGGQGTGSKPVVGPSLDPEIVVVMIGSVA
jgi:hypothetical protein